MKIRLIIVLLFLKGLPINLCAFNLSEDFKIQYLKGNSTYYHKSHNNINYRTISDYQSLRLIYKKIGISKSLYQLETIHDDTYKARASIEVYDILFFIPFDDFSLSISKNIFASGRGRNNYGEMEFQKSVELLDIISSYIFSYNFSFFSISIGYIENDFIFSRNCEYEPCGDEWFLNKDFIILYGLNF